MSEYTKEELEKGLDKACSWLHEVNQQYNMGFPQASAETFKHFFLDQEFQQRMAAIFDKEMC